MSETKFNLKVLTYFIALFFCHHQFFVGQKENWKKKFDDNFVVQTNYDNNWVSCDHVSLTKEVHLSRFFISMDEMKKREKKFKIFFRNEANFSWQQHQQQQQKQLCLNKSIWSDWVQSKWSVFSFALKYLDFWKI